MPEPHCGASLAWPLLCCIMSTVSVGGGGCYSLVCPHCCRAVSKDILQYHANTRCCNNSTGPVYTVVVFCCHSHFLYIFWLVQLFSHTTNPFILVTTYCSLLKTWHLNCVQDIHLGFIQMVRDRLSLWWLHQACYSKTRDIKWGSHSFPSRHYFVHIGHSSLKTD